MKPIRTSRLILRDLRKSDWKSVHDYASDAEVVRYMDWGPNTQTETGSFIRRALKTRKKKPRFVYTLAVVQALERKLIGGCGVYVSNPKNREGWIGYCLNRNYWGNGYATEAANALVDFGFRELGLHRIFATCQPENVASARVLEKAGMKLEGHLREHTWAKSRWRDSLIYSILEQERFAGPTNSGTFK